VIGKKWGFFGHKFRKLWAKRLKNTSKYAVFFREIVL